jgi:nitroreductase
LVARPGQPDAHPTISQLERLVADEMGIFEVMRNSRAMRRLKPDPVPEEALVQLIDAANQAPSGSNAQPARWIVVRDAEQRRRLADLNREAVQAYLEMRAVRPLLQHQDAGRQERIGKAVDWQAQHLHEIPALVFACIQLAAERVDTFMAGLGSGGSVWPGVQNLLLAARVLGLGATPTTIVFRDRAAVKEVLGLPANIEPVCMIPVGYPMGNFGPVTRQPVGEIMRWDRWT